MKLAVISFSGNVGKTTIARHLLAPRVPGAKVLSIESINVDGDQDHVMRGRQFAELQEYLQVFQNVVVDIGASNVEELLALMRRYRGSQEDFDYFIVPTVPTRKQQQDTIATLAELSRLCIAPGRVRLVFNMLEDASEFERVFEPVLAFVRQTHVADVSPECRLGFNEIYARVNGAASDISALAADPTDYKAEIAATSDTAQRLALAQRLAVGRLARGVVPELDACFTALRLESHAGAANPPRTVESPAA
jgi:MinD-like ATPase involved in chromosome partitioning or flagellar assembly